MIWNQEFIKEKGENIKRWFENDYENYDIVVEYDGHLEAKNKNYSVYDCGTS